MIYISLSNSRYSVHAPTIYACAVALSTGRTSAKYTRAMTNITFTGKLLSVFIKHKPTASFPVPYDIATVIIQHRLIPVAEESLIIFLLRSANSAFTVVDSFFRSGEKTFLYIPLAHYTTMALHFNVGSISK